LLRSFEGLQLPKPLLILFQFRRENSFRRVIQAKLCQVLQAQLHQVTPATIRNDSFKLIDTLASEGVALCSEGAQPAPTISSNKLCGCGLIVDFIPTTVNPLLPPALNGTIAPAH
jgi:hypothetical protein